MASKIGVKEFSFLIQKNDEKFVNISYSFLFILIYFLEKWLAMLDINYDF